MPFKSEKQRRYLWANEPEIARDWTDTYGNRIQAFDGGIMELALAQQARQMYALGQLVSKNKDVWTNIENDIWKRFCKRYAVESVRKGSDGGTHYTSVLGTVTGF